MECGLIFIYVIFTSMYFVAGSLFDAALYKDCNQSSTCPLTYDGRTWLPGGAVDGIIDYDESCSHTMLNETNPWWQVDLAWTYPVHSVVVRNRAYLGGRLSNFTVWVSTDETKQGEMCTFHSGAVAQESVEVVPCDIIVLGRFVRITKEEPALTLCEVQVLVMDGSGTFFRQLMNKIVEGDFESEMSITGPFSCAADCQRSPSCLAFGFNKGTGTCKLYSSTNTTAGNNAGWGYFIIA